MTQHIVYLALGANLGDRQKNLEESLHRLAKRVAVLASSQLYETTPAYVLDQPNFLNIVIKGQTDLLAVDLLAFLKDIENGLGREETIRYGPRKIDLDILFYDDIQVDLPSLQIPHLRLAERAFVLRPLADIAPDFIHPVLKKTIHQLLAELPPDDGILNVTKFLIPNL